MSSIRVLHSVSAGVLQSSQCFVPLCVGTWFGGIVWADGQSLWCPQCVIFLKDKWEVDGECGWPGSVAFLLPAYRLNKLISPQRPLLVFPRGMWFKSVPRINLGHVYTWNLHPQSLNVTEVCLWVFWFCSSPVGHAPLFSMSVWVSWQTRVG